MPALQPFGEVNLRVTLNIAASVPIGTILSASASVSNVAGESNLANNSDSVSTTVTGSFDPNDISVSPLGFDTEGYITNDELLKYSIRFQNTGNDTAFTVVVVDTLPAG